jgi:hypothetical protein
VPDSHCESKMSCRMLPQYRRISGEAEENRNNKTSAAIALYIVQCFENGRAFCKLELCKGCEIGTVLLFACVTFFGSK